MSQIVLSPNASGTGQFTVAAPNSNTNRTLTLPDATGTIIYGTQPTGTIVGTTDTQTLTNKTLTSPTLTTPNIDSAQIPTVSGSAPIYMCRAWVNFDGTASGTFAGGTSTVSRTSGSTTATVTTTNDHGLITGNNVWALTGVAAGAYTVTVTGAKTFTITTVATTVLTNASITFAVNTISGSGNISSIADNGTGIFTANFATAMPDANYSTNVSGCNQGDAAGRNTTATIRSGVYSTTQVGMMLYDGSNADRAISCLAVYR